MLRCSTNQQTKLERLDKVNRVGVLTLLFARIIYAINWFNIASIFSHIASDFKQDVSLLGLITASFFVGIGIFQVPGGILAAKQGSKKTAIYGMTIASSAALLCGLSSQLQQIEVLRFVVGLGMAFFFGPSVTLITRYLGRRSEGLAVGLLNSAHSVGGIIGLFGWVIIAEIIGWRQSLLVSGGLGLISSLLLIVLLPRKEEQEQEQQESGKGFEIKVSDVRRVLFDKSLWIWISIAWSTDSMGSNFDICCILFGRLFEDKFINGWFSWKFKSDICSCSSSCIWKNL